MIQKELIEARFSKAISSYDDNAQVQKLIARQMIAFLKKNVQGDINHIAEFGCGTGIYTRLLAEAFHPECLWINDLCKGLADYYSAWGGHSVSFCPGDIENTAIPPGQDLITGCSAIQWLDDEAGFIGRCHRLLKQDGLLAFSSFGGENLCEMRNLTGIGLDYYTKTEYEQMLSGRFQVVCSHETLMQLHFESANAVLRHLKNTGVTGISDARWSRLQLTRFCREYEQKFSDEKGVVLTYHPIYMIAKAKKNYSK